MTGLSDACADDLQASASIDTEATPSVYPETDMAGLYELVTPMTEELLRWWFGEDACAARRFNFRAGQRQAILNTIVAHEVLAVSNGYERYQQLAHEAWSDMTGIPAAGGRHSRYSLTMAGGIGRTWVLHALLIWQLLNRFAALANEIDDPRFTRRFLIVVSGAAERDRLLETLRGSLHDGQRDFATSGVRRYAELFIPAAYREHVFRFMRGSVSDVGAIGIDAAAMEDSMVAVVDMPVLGCTTGGILDSLRRLPDLMVFSSGVACESEPREAEWQQELSAFAAAKARRLTQIDFSDAFPDGGRGRQGAELFSMSICRG